MYTRLRGIQITVLGHMWVIFTFTWRTAAAVIILVSGMLGLTASVLASVNPGDVLIADGDAGTRLDGDAGTAGRGALFKIDPNGNRTVISDFGNAEQGDLGVFPLDVAIDLDSSGNVVNILVIDSAAGTAGRGASLQHRPIEWQPYTHKRLREREARFPRK